MDADDPFRFHPELRDLLTPATKSRYRDGFLDFADQITRERELPADWRTPDAEREAARRAFLDARDPCDLWVFAYGSLMWDPALVFTEVRHVRIEGHSRRFCLCDDMGGRGSPEAPGLMAALDTGGHCEGLAFRIAAEAVERETYYLWARELIAPGYNAVMLPAKGPEGALSVLTFTANHAEPMIRGDIPHAEQVRLIATGQGDLGSSRDYLESLVIRLDALGIDDAGIDALWRDVQAWPAAPGGGIPPAGAGPRHL